MRLKDWLQGPYVFGRQIEGNRVDVAYNMEDLLTSVKESEATQVIQLMDNYSAAVWWLFDQTSEETKEKFRDLVAECGDPKTGNFSAKAWGGK